MKNTFLILIFFLNYCGLIFSQENPHGDLSSALPICEQGTYTITSLVGYGQNNEEFNFSDLGTSFHETNSTWFKWKGSKGGSLAFDLIPSDLDDDLDFMLFEKKSSGDLIPIRCMTTGQNFGIRTRSNCKGITGLDLNSLDKIETDGCKKGSDNFLKHLEIRHNTEYYLLVNNYESNAGFIIDFYGSAGLSNYEVCKPKKVLTQPAISPNPAYNTININLPENLTGKPGNLTILNMEGGRAYFSKEPSLQTQMSISINSFPSGSYLVLLHPEEGSIFIEKFIKI